MHAPNAKLRREDRDRRRPDSEAPRSGAGTLVELLRQRAEGASAGLAYTFLGDAGRAVQRLSFGELWQRARALAALLQARGHAGERAILLHPPGLEFIVAFFGCVCAGMIPVPTAPPRPGIGSGRLRMLLRDSDPQWLLADAGQLTQLAAFRDREPELSAVPWLDTGAVEPEGAASWRAPAPKPEELAYLQYTSGSTSEPRGVMVSHGNVLHNLALLDESFEHTADSVIVSWLPHFHDMGLLYGALQPLYNGIPCFLMAPASFVRRPVSWLRAISAHRATHTIAPNFAYDLCVSKIKPEQRAELDLSCLEVATNGAEPVRAATLRRFTAAFEPCGFRASAFASGYGLAEATLKVAVGRSARGPTRLRVDAGALQKRVVVEAADDHPSGEIVLVGCGHPSQDTDVAIIDPQTLRRLPEGRIGEIWVAGRSVALGYWRRPEETLRTFAACPADSGLGEEPAQSAYLATGDLGFLWHGELFVTGRLKDLIILDGRNHYPQDIELTVESCHPSLHPGGSAAFSIEAEGGEHLVVVAEVERGSRPEGDDGWSAAIRDAIRRAVAAEHDVRVHRAVLIRRGTIAKTSSGKLRRSAYRESFLAGSLEELTP